jgi:hypothetical protein
MVIPMSMAVNAYRLKTGLVFTSHALLTEENGFEMISRANLSDTILFYPAIQPVPRISQASIQAIPFTNKSFSAYQISFPAKTIQAKIEQPGTRNAVISFENNSMEGLNDIFLKIDYTGDKAQAFLDGRLVADHFYYGAPWEIGIKRFAGQLKSQPLYLYFHPIAKDAACLDYLKGKLPPFGDQQEYLKINSITVIPEYKCRVEMD